MEVVWPVIIFIALCVAMVGVVVISILLAAHLED